MTEAAKHQALSPLGVIPPVGPRCVHLPLSTSPDELARFAVGLANARGGTIWLGSELLAQEASSPDATELHPLMVTHAIFELSGGRLTVNVQHQPLLDGRQMLIVFVPQAPYVLSATNGAAMAWNGAHLVPILPRDSYPIADQDYTSTVPADASLADLDPNEVARLRSLGAGLGAGLADLDFLQQLGLIVPHSGALRPTLAAILLAGTAAAIRAHIPQSEVCYYHHFTNEVEFQFREDLQRPIPALLARISELIQARNRFTPVQVGLFRIEVWDHDEVVYREALLNALTHRDYTLRDVVHVHQYPDRLEIMNPGGLTGGITPSNILRHQPKRRNPLLAEVLSKLGLVERAGVGVDKMFSLMLKHGKEPPEFLNYPDSVTLTLYSHGFDARFVQFIARKQEEMQTLSLDMLIVLSLLSREKEVPRAQLARALQLPEDRTPRLLREMASYGLIVRAGVGRGIAYLLSEETLNALGRDQAGTEQLAQTSPPVAPSDQNATTTAPALLPSVPSPSRPAASSNSTSPSLGFRKNSFENGPTRDEIRAVALALARENGTVTNLALRSACQLSSQQAWRVLRKLVGEGLLIRRGSGGKNVSYALAQPLPRPIE